RAAAAGGNRTDSVADQAVGDRLPRRRQDQEQQQTKSRVSQELHDSSLNLEGNESGRACRRNWSSCRSPAIASATSPRRRRGLGGGDAKIASSERKIVFTFRGTWPDSRSALQAAQPAKLGGSGREKNAPKRGE